MSIDNTNTEVLNLSIDDVESQSSNSPTWHTYSCALAIRGVHNMARTNGLLIDSLFLFLGRGQIGYHHCLHHLNSCLFVFRTTAGELSHSAFQYLALYLLTSACSRSNSGLPSSFPYCFSHHLH